MRKWLYIFGAFALAGSIQSLVACSSSNAHPQADFDSLQAEIANLNSRVTALEQASDRLNDIDAALARVERQQGPRAQAVPTTARRSEAVLSGGPGKLGWYGPIGFTGPDCTGDAYALGLSATAARQGFVFGTPDAYKMVAPGTETTEFVMVSQRRSAARNCDPEPSITRRGYAIVDNVEETCAVPEGGLPATVWPEGSPPSAATHNAEIVEVWTEESCLTIVPAESMPPVVVGAG